MLKSRQKIQLLTKHQIRSCKTHNAIIVSPIGRLGLIIFEDKLAGIQFLPSVADLFIQQNSVVRLINSKIKKYFCGSNLQFNIPIQFTSGTPLQQKIWKSLMQIPCGETTTYGALAQKIGTSPRVIGNACRQNPIPIVIPCHRVVSSSGLGGYYGKYNKTFLEIKKWLLMHECRNIENRF